MDLYVLDNGFKKQEVIDAYESLVWADRYYGDGDCVIKLPYSPGNLEILAPDTLVLTDDSNEPMIIETQEIDDGKLICTGISLMQWMNNRFIKSGPLNSEGVPAMVGVPVGQTMSIFVARWLIEGSSYLLDDNYYIEGDLPYDEYASYHWEDSTLPVIDASRLAIPNLVVAAYDTSGGSVDIFARNGPAFDVLKEIGETYGIGQKITLDDVSDSDYVLGYRNYKGVDRTGTVKFSEDNGALGKLRGIRSRVGYLNGLWFTAPHVGDSVNTQEGVPYPQGIPAGLYFAGDPSATGFGLRAQLVEDNDVDDLQVWGPDGIPGDGMGGEYTTARDRFEGILAPKAYKILQNSKLISNIDAQLEEFRGFTYGVDFSLGDIVAVEGFFENVENVRITEWVRTNDVSGEKHFPGITTLTL